MTKEMDEAGTRDSGLRWEVFVAPGIPTAASDVPPGDQRLMWSPISSTLIYGKQDAVLVDTSITVGQADAPVAIYITHGHGDHFFGIGVLLDHFPHSRAVATRDVVKVMRQQASPQSLSSFWNPFFPDQIPNHNQSASHPGSNYRDVRSFGAPDRRRHDLGSGRRHLWLRPIRGSHRGRGKEPWRGAVHAESEIRPHVDLTRSHEGGIHGQA